MAYELLLVLETLSQVLKLLLDNEPDKDIMKTKIQDLESKITKIEKLMEG